MFSVKVSKGFGVECLQWRVVQEMVARSQKGFRASRGRRAFDMFCASGFCAVPAPAVQATSSH